jgi:hypothetical protein
VDTSIPLFAWSSNQIFSQHNEQILQTLTEQDIEDTLKALLLKAEGKTFITEIQGTPEAVIIFIEPKLRTDQVPHFGSAYSTSPSGGAFSFLKNIVESSKSSLVAPYVTASNQYSLLDSLLVSVTRNMKGQGSVLLVSDAGASILPELSGQSGVQTTTLSELKGYSNLFTNGVADLIVVCLSEADTVKEFEAHDELIGSLSQLVSTATSGNFVGIYTGNSVTSSDIITTFENPNAYLFRPSYLVDRYWTSVEVDPDNTTGNGTGPRTYLTGPILETFMVVIALITMVFVGMCNLCKLQTPETYEVPKPQIKM